MLPDSSACTLKGKAPNKITNNKIQFQEVDLYYSADGTLIKSIVDTDDDNTEHLPCTTDRGYKELHLLKNYSNALIMEVDVEDDRNDWYYGYTEVDIIHNRIHKEILFDSTEIGIRLHGKCIKMNFPKETVRNVIEKQYKEYNLEDAEYIEKD